MTTGNAAPARLRLVHEGLPDTVVIGVDFAERREEASVPELAAQFSPFDPTFVECDVSLFDALPAESARPADYVRIVVDEVVAAGREVVGVVGRCTGVALACEISEALHAARLAQPVTVLFDPEVADHKAVFYLYEKAMRGLAAGAGDELVRAAVRDLPEWDGRELATTLLDMTDSYRSLVANAIVGVGAPADFGEFLASRYAAFNRYLLCASRSRIQVTHGPVHRILCRDHEPRASEHGQPAQRLDVDHDDLMASPQAAAALLDLLSTAAL
jgi:hypothetical protein